MKILVVDDDPTILGLVEQILVLSTRHRVVTAASAKSALEAIEEAEVDFDCLLVDIQMPEVDGIVLVRLIRETPGYRDVPIVMLTAMHEKQYLNQAFSAGATDYLTKPFEYQDLCARLPVAQKLAVEKTRRKLQPLMAGEMKHMGGEPKDFRLADPIPVGKLDGAIDYSEFENYVRQLTRRRLSDCTVFAVKIGAVDTIYVETSSEDFRTLVGNAALAIQDSLLQRKGVFSYRGNGVFLCVPETRLDDTPQVMQTVLNGRLQSSTARSGRAGIELRVGDQVAFDSIAEVDVLETMSAAVASVESRSLESGDVPRTPKRFLASFGMSSEERHLEKRAYEALLHNALSETPDRGWLRRLERRDRNLGRS